MSRLRLLALLAAAATLLPSLGVVVTGEEPADRDNRASLWVEPDNPQQLDLLYGPWGPEQAPDPNAVYTFVEQKHSGINPGMTVKDPAGRQWSVKLPHPDGIDAEAPVEVTLSRLLSAAGYHQPPVYYLPAFTLKDDWGVRTMTGARFRLKLESLKEIGGWSWDDSPFADSQPQRGLLVLLMLFNSTDLKPSNNSLYEYDDGRRVQRWYAVRDIGAALGDTRRLAPRKGDIDAFAQDPYILGLRNGFVDFAYRAWHRRLVENRITPDDVDWAHRRLEVLTDRQWHDAFRAGGWPAPIADRLIAALRARMGESRQLLPRQRETRTQ